MIPHYDNIPTAMRKEQIADAENDLEARQNRQGSMAQTCAEEIAEVVIRVDLDDEEDLLRSIEHVKDIAANARIFLLEALQNKRLRKALKG